MKNLQTFEAFVNESVVNEADMTKFYDGFVMYDHKNKKEYKSRYQKGVKNNRLEDEIIKKIAKETEQMNFDQFKAYLKKNQMKHTTK